MPASQRAKRAWLLATFGGKIMTRLFATLGACFCVAIMLVASATENVRGDFDRQTNLIHAASLFISAISLVFYCGFAALHSVSRVESGTDRMGWIILTVGCNVFGSLFYYLTKYQDFRSHGLGGLPRSLKRNSHGFSRATPSELKAEHVGDGQARSRSESIDFRD